MGADVRAAPTAYTLHGQRDATIGLACKLARQVGAVLSDSARSAKTAMAWLGLATYKMRASRDIETTREAESDTKRSQY